MFIFKSRRSRPNKHLRRGIARLRLEALETRTVPASIYFPFASSLSEHEPNDILDPESLTGNLGQLSIVSPLEVRGTIGNGAYGDADVDWYRFSLETPARISL